METPHFSQEKWFSWDMCPIIGIFIGTICFRDDPLDCALGTIPVTMWPLKMAIEFLWIFPAIKW